MIHIKKEALILSWVKKK